MPPIRGRPLHLKDDRAGIIVSIGVTDSAKEKSMGKMPMLLNLTVNSDALPVSERL